MSLAVTGANSGIGETVAVQFQQAGAKVFGVARRKEAVEAARARHPQVTWLLTDVAQADQINAALEAAVNASPASFTSASATSHYESLPCWISFAVGSRRSVPRDRGSTICPRRV